MTMRRADFPLLSQRREGNQLIYFDNAATTHKPQMVIDALVAFYTQHNAPVYRGVYMLAEHATMCYEQARATVAQFIGARDAAEIVFTRGTTESINCIAAVWGQQHIQAGDEILITQLEHHSNLLPWQRLAHQKQARLVYIPINGDGTLNLTTLPSLLTSKTKLVALAHVSNMLGTQHDIATVIQAAHAVGAKVLIDAAQSVPHQRINVQELKPDFLVFSGHKMVGPTGIGVLYCNAALHDQLVPYHVGGGMVYQADFAEAVWQKMPQLLEAGTPAIAQAIGLAAAIEYLTAYVDFDALRVHQAQLCAQLIDGLARYESVTILGPVEQLKKEGHLVAFTVDDMHAHDVAAYLDAYGICVRAGHHCAQPAAQKLGIESSVRVSFYGYNTPEEVERFLAALGAIVYHKGMPHK